MNFSTIKFDLYLACATMFGWIAFSWITFLLSKSESADGEQSMLFAVPYLTVSCIAFLAAMTRQPFFLLATASASLFLAAFFMMVTDYWWFWTETNTALSFLSLVFSVYLFAKDNNKVELSRN